MPANGERRTTLKQQCLDTGDAFLFPNFFKGIDPQVPNLLFPLLVVEVGFFQFIHGLLNPLLLEQPVVSGYSVLWN